MRTLLRALRGWFRRRRAPVPRPPALPLLPPDEALEALAQRSYVEYMCKKYGAYFPGDVEVRW
jgi:hypothetical protein